MTDVELLPLPLTLRHPSDNDLADHVQTYARANVAHATAPLQAEIEALRAEVEDYRGNGAAAVRWAPFSAHWSFELRRLFGNGARDGIDSLERRHRDSLARAERLAEALLLAEEHINAITPEWYSAGQKVLAEIRAALKQENKA